VKISAILIGVSVLVLSACCQVPGKLEGNSSAATCSPSNCIPVSVAIINGAIHAPDDTFTYANHEVIEWTIVTPGNYTFPDKGIEFQKQGVFVCDPHQGGNKTFRCRKNGNPAGKYKYTVNVDAVANPLSPLPLHPLDPFIHNL
jgi:hypothetical protein